MPIPFFYPVMQGGLPSGHGLVWLGWKLPKLLARVQIPVAAHFYSHIPSQICHHLHMPYHTPAVKFKGIAMNLSLASDDCYDPDESNMTMIWILSEELATITFGNLCRQCAFNRTLHVILLCIHK